MKILGIDPGTAIVGWGVIEKNDPTPAVVCAYGHITTPTHMPLPQRLAHIANDVNTLLDQYAPDEVAVEELFFFKNHKTAMSVAHARGVILLCAQQRKIPLGEYTPLQIKQALTNYGRADKKQIQKAVQGVLGLEEVPQPDDTADALAIALCHSYSRLLRNKTALK